MEARHTSRIEKRQLVQGGAKMKVPKTVPDSQVNDVGGESNGL